MLCDCFFRVKKLPKKRLLQRNLYLSRSLVFLSFKLFLRPEEMNPDKRGQSIFFEIIFKSKPPEEAFEGKCAGDRPREEPFSRPTCSPAHADSPARPQLVADG